MEGRLMIVVAILGVYSAHAAEPTWTDVSKDESENWDMLSDLKQLLRSVRTSGSDWRPHLSDMVDRLDPLKRGAPLGFSAVRGRRGPPLGFSAVRGKRGPPLGFSAVRGKRGPPLGFSAVRGKRLPPMGFSAVRGKRGPPSGFSAVRGKRKIPTGFSAVRGKKSYEGDLKEILMQNYDNELLRGAAGGGLNSDILPQDGVGFDNSLWDEDHLSDYPHYFDDHTKESDLLQAIQSQEDA